MCCVKPRGREISTASTYEAIRDFSRSSSSFQLVNLRRPFLLLKSTNSLIFRQRMPPIGPVMPPLTGLLTMEKLRAAFLLSSTSTRLHPVLHEPEKPRIMLPLCSHRSRAFLARFYTNFQCQVVQRILRSSRWMSTLGSSSITPEHGPIRHCCFSTLDCMASDFRSGPLTTSVSVSRKAKLDCHASKCNHVIPEPVCSSTFKCPSHLSALLLSDHGLPWPYRTTLADVVWHLPGTVFLSA